MTTDQVIFIILSVFTLGTALLVVTLRNLFHAALALMATFLGVAGLYVMLDAGFLAAAQLLVYIGAISILLIFAIMMTRRLMNTTESAFNSQGGASLVTAVIGFLVIAWAVSQFSRVLPQVVQKQVDMKPMSPDVIPYIQSSVAAMGQAFVDPNGFVLPFEIASVLLLAGLIGAIIVAWPKAEDEES
ncbi:MAG: NADH-quinone oxidoreductase subunit J [Anaerolineae bacterium]|nr:NADH-quinone oxidoreductase subunit J [Anaerolineae bacterium]